MDLLPKFQMGNTHCYGAKRENKQRLSISEDLQNHQETFNSNDIISLNTEQMNQFVRYEFKDFYTHMDECGV